MELENGWIIVGKIGEHEYVCEHFVCDSQCWFQPIYTVTLHNLVMDSELQMNVMKNSWFIFGENGNWFSRILHELFEQN